jgi:ribonucleoside-diphosphate reductase alpha chain
MGKTDFTDPAAVDAWDRWFRWREGMHLHDLTVDATWERVARAVASAQGPQAAFWAQHYVDALSKWQMLPGARLLHDAGTGSSSFEMQISTKKNTILAASNIAVLNVNAFVRRSRGTMVWFDRDEFMRVCALAVRFLDDALFAGATPMAGLRIGVIGMADALSQLGVGYAGDAALAQAREIAIAFAEGCLRGDLAMARERGSHPHSHTRWVARLHARRIGDGLRSELRRYGMRHPHLTAIMSDPRLALLANNSSDGLDPALHTNAHEQQQPFTMRWQDAALDSESALFVQTAQLALRAAIQPWIDRPIDTPLLTLQELDENTRERCVTLAAALKLKPPRWRLPLG